MDIFNALPLNYWVAIAVAAVLAYMNREQLLGMLHTSQLKAASFNPLEKVKGTSTGAPGTVASITAAWESFRNNLEAAGLDEAVKQADDLWKIMNPKHINPPKA